MQFVGMNSAFLTAQGGKGQTCVALSAAALCTAPIRAVRAAAAQVEEVAVGEEIAPGKNSVDVCVLCKLTGITREKKGEIVMPFGDGTGPLGMGPLTGRRLGYCAGYPGPGAYNPIGFRGFGSGFGRGRGFGNRYWYWVTGLPGWARGFYGFPYAYPPAVPFVPGGPAPAESEVLKAQAAYLEEQLAAIKERLAELGKQVDAEKKE
ncbi:hypothetical protein kuro4_22230 [Gelria sp. Kuro-4]|nr:hypothetical protein kuro4_22230 [Gelria sp. Kuro-4]